MPNCGLRIVCLAAAWVALAGSFWTAQVWGKSSDFLIESWQDHEGVTESSALAVAQTPDGYLWVGSPDGLLRFNGVNFCRAEKFTDLAGLTETVPFLETDRSGRLWAQGAGRLSLYDHGVWRAIIGTNLEIRSVAEDLSGRVLLGGMTGQLYQVVDGKVKRFSPPEGLKPSGVFCVTDARDGQLWLANRGFIGRLTSKGWLRFGPADAISKPLLAAPARSGGLWVYLPGVLQRYQADGTVTNYPAPDLDQPRSLMEDRSGAIWIGSITSGLTHLRPGGELFAINAANGLAHNAIWCLAEDLEGNIWAGGTRNGLIRLKPRQFVTFGRADGLPDNIVRTVTETSPGEIVVGTHGGGIARIHEGTVEAERPIPSDSGGQYVWSLLQDRQGRLWIGTFNDGLYVQAGGVTRQFPLPATMGRTASGMMEDSHGRIWVGTPLGLCMIDGGTTADCVTNPLIAGIAITALAEDAKSGAIWIGTYAHGVFRMDGANPAQVTKLPGLPGERINSLTMDAEGYLWIGIFEHGLACVHRGKTTLIGRPQGLPAQTIGSILDDGHGWFWLGSTHGILRVAGAELHRLAEQPSPPAVFNVFNVSDGLGSDYCDEGYQPNAWRDHAGHLWFGTDRGVVTVDPAHLRLNTNPPPVVIESVAFTDRFGTNHFSLKPYVEPLVLPAGSVELDFSFYGLSYTAPEKVAYAYLLQGVDQHWMDLGNHHELHFRELAPGRYVLQLKAANNDGVWNETGTALAFTIRPFIWQTLWFKLLAVLAVTGGAGWLVRRMTRRQFQRRINQLQRERSHEQERARLATVMENTSDLVLFANRHGGIIHINPAGRKLIGVAEDEKLGELTLDQLQPRQAARVIASQGLPAARQKGTWESETALLHRDGHEIPVSLVLIVHKDAEGQDSFISAIARDVTERKSLEDQLRQAQKMEAVGQLAGGVAHDFNNILSSLLLQTELIGMTEHLPPEVREGLQQIGADTHRAADLTRQLLLFSRRQVMQSRLLDLNEVVMNLARMLQRLIREDVRLQLHPHPAPLMTFADAGMVEQVLMNLAVNARDAMPKGGDLLIETTETTVDASEARLNPEAAPGRYVCLSVTDTGSGIAPEILPRIFEPFFTTKEPGKGTGLGLATVFGIVKQHHGWIKLENRPGQGATFRVYLPASAETAAPPAAATAKPKSNGGTETILLVEDELAVRTFTRRILERHGYQVLEATEGAEALNLWREHRASVALLLTDLVMPGELDGQALGRRLRADQPDLKVIFASGYSAEIAGRDFQLRPGEAFVQKPFAAEHLLETIRRCLDSGSGRI